MVMLNGWTVATGNLAWGVQHALHDTLTLVAEEKVRLVYGMDDNDKHPCLINAVANMLSLDVTNVHPSSMFPDIVRNFDVINSDLFRRGINTDEYVSPLAAEVLLRNFGTLKDRPVEEAVEEQPIDLPYTEPTDADMQDALNRMLTGPNFICDQSPVSNASKYDAPESVSVEHLAN